MAEKENGSISDISNSVNELKEDIKNIKFDVSWYKLEENAHKISIIEFEIKKLNDKINIITRIIKNIINNSKKKK